MGYISVINFKLDFKIQKSLYEKYTTALIRLFTCSTVVTPATTNQTCPLYKRIASFSV